MTTAAVFVAFLLVLAGVLMALRGVGIGWRTWDLGWIGMAIIVILGVFLVLTGAISF
jgi:hypothetical protein